MIFPWFYKILREAHQPLRIEIKTKIPNFHEQKNPFSCPRRDFFGHYLVTCISHASNLPKTVQQEHYEPHIKLHDCSLPTCSGLMLTWTFTLLLRNVPSVVPCCKNNISNLSWATRAFYTARHAKGINFISCWQNSLESLFLYVDRIRWSLCFCTLWHDMKNNSRPWTLFEFVLVRVFYFIGIQSSFHFGFLCKWSLAYVDRVQMHHVFSYKCSNNVLEQYAGLI